MLYANCDLLVQKAAEGNRFLLVGEQGVNCRQVKIPVCKRFIINGEELFNVL